MIRVTNGFDEAAWRAWPADSLTHDAGWLATMCGRLPGEPLTVRYGDRLGFVGALVSRTDAYESYNPHAILWRPDPVFDVSGAATRRERLATLPSDPGVTLPALVLVAPGYSGDPVGPDRQHPATVLACLRYLRSWAARRGVASVSALYTVDGTDAIRAAVADMGGVSYPLVERWLMPVRWSGWDGYLASLPVARAKEVRRELRRAADAGAHPAQIDPVVHAERIVEARCALLARYGQYADAGAEGRRLRGLIETFGDRLTVYAAVQGGEPVAVAVCVRHGRTLHVLYSGVGVAGAHVPFAHFVATYYAVLQEISALDTDEVDYGIGHGASKAPRGCQPVTTFGHTYGLDAQRNRLLRMAGQLLGEREKYRVRT